MKSANSKHLLDDVPVLLPRRIQQTRVTAESALRFELGVLIVWAPTGAAITTEVDGLDTPSAFKA